MKSALVHDEIAQMQQQYAGRYAQLEVHNLNVPGVDGVRTLVECQPKQVTSV